MAQTKRKKRGKHRGNAAGMIETHGRTGRATNTGGGKKGSGGGKQTSAQRRQERLDRPPSWMSATNRAVITAALFVPIVVLLLDRTISSAIILGAVMFVVYIPLGYYTDVFIYRRRMARRGGGRR